MVLTALLLVGGVIFWHLNLTADPPMHFSGLGQSLSTDPAQYTFHARNKVLFGAFDPYNYPRWTVYQHSLTSLVAYIWFSLAGVSLAQSQVVGIILCLGGLVLLILALLRFHSPWVTSAVAFVYLINVTLYTYGRLSYLENGLIFLASLVFFVYTRWGNTLWGVALSGGLVAIAMLMGKLFGMLLLPALLLAIYFSGTSQRTKYILTAVGTFFVVGLSLLFILYGKNIAAAYAYVGEQAYGLRGFPKGLRSPWAFIEHLISYGYDNHLFFLNIDLLLFLLVGSFLLVMSLAAKYPVHRLPRTVIFSLFWTIAAFVGLMPLNYSPLRYTLLLIPPIIVFCFTMLDLSLSDKDTGLKSSFKKLPHRLTIKDSVLFGFVFWLALFQLIANTVFFNTIPHPIRLLTWVTLPAAVGLVFLLRYLLKRKYLRITKTVLYATVGGVLLLSAFFNTIRIKSKHFDEHNFNILEANRDLDAILSPGAVVSGPYGPALTIDTGVKSFIHLFGVAKVDSTLFDRYPITHLAVDVSNWTEAVRNYPVLADLEPIASYWIRDVEVRLYNISKVFNNPQARRYQESIYEQAAMLNKAGDTTKALQLARQFFESHPQSKSCGMLIAEILWNNERAEELNALLPAMARQFPTDFNIQLQYARFLQILSALKKDNSLLNLALQYYEKGVKLNPYKSDQAKKVYIDIASKLGQPLPQ